MSKGKRDSYTSEFKLHVALEAMKGEKTLAQLASEYHVHPSQITKWKEQLNGSASAVFGAPAKPHPRHKTYPYLLKDVDASSPNHVWSTDITYIPTRFGFMYLTAIVDWYSRRVLSYRLSNTMGVDFCVDALKEALQNFGTPEIFNSDQGGAVHIGGLHWSAEGERHCHKHGWKRTCIRQHLHGALLAKPQARMVEPELL